MSLSQGYSVALALSYDYGQRAWPREREQAQAIARHFKVPHRHLSLPWFKEFAQKGLLSSNEMLPHPEMSELSQMAASEKSAKAVWVPNRNGLFIELAAGIAEERNIQYLILGFNAEEAATFPDNSIQYLNAINHALEFSTQNQVKVFSPTSALHKTQIVAWAKGNHFPFELLWSCYENLPKMCGRCESCMRLKRALNENEVSYREYFNDSLL